MFAILIHNVKVPSTLTIFDTFQMIEKLLNKSAKIGQISGRSLFLAIF